MVRYSPEPTARGQRKAAPCAAADGVGSDARRPESGEIRSGERRMSLSRQRVKKYAFRAPRDAMLWTAA
jgi:hypothetical protein